MNESKIKIKIKAQNDIAILNGITAFLIYAIFWGICSIFSPVPSANVIVGDRTIVVSRWLDLLFIPIFFVLVCKSVGPADEFPDPVKKLKKIVIGLICFSYTQIYSSFMVAPFIEAKEPIQILLPSVGVPLGITYFAPEIVWFFFNFFGFKIKLKDYLSG